MGRSITEHAVPAAGAGGLDRRNRLWWRSARCSISAWRCRAISVLRVKLVNMAGVLLAVLSDRCSVRRERAAPHPHNGVFHPASRGDASRYVTRHTECAGASTRWPAVLDRVGARDIRFLEVGGLQELLDQKYRRDVLVTKTNGGCIANATRPRTRGEGSSAAGSVTTWGVVRLKGQEPLQRPRVGCGCHLLKAVLQAVGSRTP